jgi:dolichol-phosphate mannosyltransferase
MALAYGALIWLILPTYAEAAGLPGVIAGARDALAHEDLHILVVDDASPDGTGALAEKLGAEVLHRPRKLGLRGRLHARARA